ncbi:exosortase family protein XrtG [Weissella confusa]
MMFWCIVVAVSVWLYALSVLKRIAWRAGFIVVGVVGVFFLIILLCNDQLTHRLMQMSTWGTGLIGSLTGAYETIPSLGIVHIISGHSAVNLFVTFECSAYIELAAYFSLALFFPFFNSNRQRWQSIILGMLFIYLSNVIRLSVTALIVRYCGPDSLVWAHVVMGRLIFYALSIMLYFYVFTRSQVLNTLTGKFGFERGTKA